MSFFGRHYIFFFIICAHHISAHTNTTSITLKNTYQSHLLEHLQPAIPQPIIIDQVTYSADIVFDQAEFAYLVDFPHKSCASAHTIAQAAFNLFCKNKFQTITLLISPSNHGCHLHFTLESLWTLKKTKISGFILGKERYLFHYLIEPGDPFDKELHRHGVQRILEACKKEGYLHSSITETIQYLDAKKEVAVNLRIDRGTLYSIDKTNISLHTHDTTDHHDLEQRYYNKYVSSLSGASYQKTIINNLATQIKRSLIKKGFLQSTITLKESIHHDTCTVDLSFSIQLGDCKKFIFIGNQHFSSDELFDKVIMFGKSALLLPNQLLIQEITQLYHDHGYLQAQVMITEEDKKLFCIINEGPLCTLDAILSDGSTDDRMQQCLDSAYMLVPHTCTQEHVQAICHRFIAAYKDAGYIHAYIKNHSLQQHDGTLYTLHLHVIPGEKTYITTIAHDLSSLSNANYPTLPTGPYTKELIADHLRLLNRYVSSNNGDPEYCSHSIKPGDDGVTLTWHYTPPTHAPFGKTIVTGSSSLPYDYLLREISYAQGEPWDPFSLKQSLLALKELSLFDHISLYPYQKEMDASLERPIILKTVLDEPFEIRAHTGCALEGTLKDLRYQGITYKIGGSFIYKNPLNRADYIILNGDFTRTYRIAEFQYWRPWICKRPIRTLVQFYNNAFKYPSRVGDSQNLYTVTQAGGLIGLSRKWRHINVGCNGGIEWMKTEISNDAPQQGLFNRYVAKAIDFEPRLLDVHVPYALLEPTILLNYVDNQLYPTRGGLTLISFKGMIPIGSSDLDAFFIKLLAEQSFFTPIPYTPIICALRLRLGHIIFQKFKNIMPSERFYLGGAFSLRGYQTDLCPPLGEVLDDQGRVQYVPQGGKSMLNLNIEFRFPVYRDLNAAIFQDFGILESDSLLHLLNGSILAGTGGGLRYNTPIGPLRFDIGVSWKRPRNNISRIAWFLTLGQAF